MKDQYFDFQGNKEQFREFLCEIYNNYENKEDVCEEVAKAIFLNQKIEESVEGLDEIEETDWVENDDAKHQLYIRDTRYHICLSKIVLDLMVNAAIVFAAEGELKIAGVLNLIWNARKSIKRIPDNCFCVYLKMYLYYSRDGVDRDEFWKRCSTETCDCNTKLFKCGYKNDDKCNMTEESFSAVLSKLCEKGICEEKDVDCFALLK